MTLTPHDAAVAARDPGLPGLALLLDTDRLATILADRLPDSGLGRLSPSYLRYKPGTSCFAGFVAEAGGRRVDLAAKAYKPRRYATERARPLPGDLRSVVGPIAIALDDQAVMVRIVPYDRELRALPRLVDPDRRAALLRRLVPTLESCEWTVLRHKPGRRHIGLLSADAKTRAIVKLYVPGDFEQARLGARFGARIGAAALLGAVARHGILASAWQPGRALVDLDGGDPALGAAMTDAGAALAMVHHQRPRDLPIRTLRGEAEAVAASALALASLAPCEARRVMALAAEVAELLLATPEQVCSLHGDFSADQVIVGADGVRLIDWDRAAIGPRGLDVGSFVARLEADAVAAGKPRPSDQAQAFKAGYAGVMGRPPRALRVWTAAALMRVVNEPFRQRLPDWPERTVALLDRVERHLERARRQKAAGASRLPLGRLA